MRKTFGITLIAMALITSACTKSSSSQAGSSGGPIKEGGTLRIAAYDGVDSMNPFVGVNNDSYATYEYTYPQLVQYDEKLAFVPDFATSWDTSGDGLNWTFHLVQGAKWSDGQPLTSADVAFTYNMIVKYQDGPTSYAAGSVAHLKSAAASDPNTVVLTYDAPVTTVLQAVQQI